MLKPSRGGGGKKEEDERQRKLEINKEGNRSEKEKKKVSFEEAGKGTEGLKREIEGLEERMKENKRTFNREVEKWKKKEEDWVLKERVWDIKIDILEERMQKIEEELKRWKEEKKVEDRMSETGERGNSRAESRWGGSVYSVCSGTSRMSEDRLSVREVDKIKRMLSSREKEERKNNVVIKGLGKEMEKEINIERVEAFFKDKLNIICKVDACWRSGNVVVVKLENEEGKLQILRNKSKLKGERIFIEKDLTWEERRIQEKINKWVREGKGKEMKDVKIGKGRIRINGEWRAWEEIERKEAEEEEKGGEERRGERTRGGSRREKEAEVYFA